MNITIAIEEVVLEGIPLSPSERPLLARAVQRELARLYARGDLVPPGRASNHDHLAAQNIALTNPVSATTLGVQVARAVHGALQR